MPRGIGSAISLRLRQILHGATISRLSDNLLRQRDALFCIYPGTSRKYLFAISHFSALTLSFLIKHGGPRSLARRIAARADDGEVVKCSDGICLTLGSVHGRVGRYGPRVPHVRTQSESVRSRRRSFAPIGQVSRRRVVHRFGGPERAVSHRAREMLFVPYSGLLRLGHSPPCLCTT